MKNYDSLYNIVDPSFLKNLPIKDLNLLCNNIRSFLIDSLSVTGGHLSSNLGVVELTVALHYAFNMKKDKLIFDVGHQCYTHKILTGRAKFFNKLRKSNGLSGFPRMDESKYDIWETGHSSTSLSAAIGMAIDRDFKNGQEHIIALIGDGALTGGMALEALNHIGFENRRVIIVLNDNKMSISKNVTPLEGLKKNTQSLFQGLNNISNVKNSIEPNKNSTKTLFENLNIKYLDKIDGHNIKELLTIFEKSKEINAPCVIHVVTKKGKGLHLAENDQVGKFHGIGPFDLSNGMKIKNKHPLDRSWSSVVSETVERLAEKDNKLICITPAMLKGSKLEFFKNKFPNRVFDVGIAEQHAATFSGALSLSTLKPILFIYSTFLQRAYDQIIHDIARQNLNIIIAIDKCGFATGDGDTHHGIYDISFLKPIPNISIVMPKDSTEAQNLLYNCLYNYNNKGPIAFRYPRGYTTLNHVKHFSNIDFCTWSIEKQGDDLTIICFGPMVSFAIEISKKMESKNIYIKVVNARFIKPMDTDMLHEIFKSNKPIIIIEEACKIGGLGSSVCEFAIENKYKNDIELFGIEDKFYNHGDLSTLRKLNGLNQDNIVEKIESLISIT